MAHEHEPVPRAAPTSTPEQSPHPGVAAAGLALAFAQAVGMGLLAAGGRGFDLLPVLGGGLYRVDALGVTLGVVWALAVGLGWPRQAGRLPALLLVVGLLHVAYAREPLLLYLGWELAGLGLVLAAGIAPRSVMVPLFASGVPLLVAWLLGLVPALAPPPGGDPLPWPAALAVALGLVVMMRSGVPLLGRWVKPLSDRAPFPAALYALAGPAVLARALVPAPWDAPGGWALALLGAAGMVGALLARAWGERGLPAASVLAAAALMGLGTAPVSAVTAVGAVLLLVVGPVWLCCRTLGSRAWGALLLAGAAPGAWLVGQGAAAAGYAVVPVIAVGGLVLLALLLVPDGDGGKLTWAGMPAGALLALVAVYPQAAVEWVARPAAGAMAGGVGVPSGLLTNWGVGLALRAPDETLQAALPATGVALAVLLAWALLRWLKLLVERAARRPEGR